MDVKEIAEVTVVPALHPPPTEQAQTHVPEQAAQSAPDVGISALRPVIQIASDGLAVLQLQDSRSGEVVFQVPSEEAARQYRERDGQEGTGTAPIEHVAASASGAMAATAAAAVVAAPQPPAQPPHAKGTETPQAVKAVESQSGSKQSNSVRVNA